MDAEDYSRAVGKLPETSECLSPLYHCGFLSKNGQTNEEKKISAPYKACLLKQKNFPFVKLPSVRPKVGDSNQDQSFIDIIPDLAKVATTKIPNLQHAVNQPQPIEIYNENTYMEFHLLLCELLTRFGQSLEELKSVQERKKRGKFELDGILKALKNVEIIGHCLRTMVRSSAIETHLKTIGHVLDVDTRKSWTPASGPEEDSDLADFQLLKPYSMRKGKPLLPWESYRDWLKLMVHYFDAAKVLITYVTSLGQSLTSDIISIAILSPALPDKDMLPWTELLETERFYPTLPGETSGKDFVEYLMGSDSYKTVHPTKEDIKKVTTSAQELKDKLELDLLTPNILTKIDELAEKVKNTCISALVLEENKKSNLDTLTKIDTPAQEGKKTLVDWYDVYTEILALTDSQPQDRPAKFWTIVDVLSTLSKDASFYSSLKQGSLHHGTNFNGKYHCEAYIASLLALLDHSGGYVDDFEERLNTLSGPQIDRIKELLDKIKASQVFMHHLNLY